MNSKAIICEVSDAIASGTQIEPFSKRGISLSLQDAYTIGSEARAKFDPSQPVGRKIGFTNRGIWEIYGVDQPIWGDMRDASVSYHSNNSAEVSLSRFCEPRIEPEVVIGLKSAPKADATNDEVAACIDWVAPGVEIVDSIYPEWSFSLADSIASGGLHGCLVVGEKVSAQTDIEQALIDLRVGLFKNGNLSEKGTGANVLDGPVSAIRYLMGGLTRYPDQRLLAAGDVITTGTMTDAKPIFSTENWIARFEGVIDAELNVTFT